MFARLIALVFAVSLVYLPIARADGFLTGTSAYDPTSKLYTYSYALQQAGPFYGKAIWLFTPTGGLDPSNPTFAPLTHTEPAGWQFTWGVGESVRGSPENALGWTWAAPVDGGVAPGTEQPGFRFTTSLPPGTVLYQLEQDIPGSHGGFSGVPDGSGTVVGPSVAASPEPSTLALFGVGILGLAGCCWHRKQSAQIGELVQAPGHR